VTRVAAIDCGTNSIRLLVADVEGGRLTDVAREMRVVRLGQDVDRTGRLAPEALARTFAALRDYADQIRDLGAGRVRMCATSATRDAANRDEFVSGCVEILGVEPEVISGAEEAQTSFAGATSTLPRDRFPAPYLVVDIGGGSTEFVLGDTAVTESISVDMGCVRLTERRLRSSPPTGEEVAAAESDIDALMARVADTVNLPSAGTLVGLAGSVTTVAALAMGIPAYDPEAIQHSRIAFADVDRVTTDLLARTREQRLEHAVMHPGRADVIGAGALILRRLMQHVGADSVVASESDILDGIALSCVAGGSSA
jgi:exopolyphosphatase/guanosine-5'-triphosphate,3'-diphosphate pyrophosphatase